MIPILVTGGAGYIGAHTSKLLSQNGYEPICYDNLSTGHKDFVKWGPLIKGELHDTEKLVRIIKKYRPEAVIHFAAKAYVGDSVKNPFLYYNNNVGGSLSLLKAMRVADLDTIIFSSTCATYGIPNTEFISEDCQQIPISPYGYSKLMIEQMMKDLSSRNQLKFVSLRYFNAAGADQDGEIGEWHDPETHLIPLAIEAGLGGRRLDIFGADFPTRDGTCIRDYVHVKDLANAHLLAMKYLQNGGTSKAFNLGTGSGFSVKEVVDTIIDLGLPVVSNAVKRRQGDPAILVADAKLANQELNWVPLYTDIKTIIETAITWHQKMYISWP